MLTREGLLTRFGFGDLDLCSRSYNFSITCIQNGTPCLQHISRLVGWNLSKFSGLLSGENLKKRTHFDDTDHKTQGHNVRASEDWYNGHLVYQSSDANFPD